MGVIVDDEDVIMPPVDLVRTQEVMQFNFTLVDKQVIDTRKKTLGKVESYAVDIASFYVIKMNVRQSPFKNLWGTTLLIDRTQIVEITDARIVVQAADLRQGKTNSLIQNPFRNQQENPQPNMAHSHQED